MSIVSKWKELSSQSKFIICVTGGFIASGLFLCVAGIVSMNNKKKQPTISVDDENVSIKKDNFDVSSFADLDANDALNSIKIINSKWLFDNKHKIFENSDLILDENSFFNISHVIEDINSTEEKIIVSFIFIDNNEKMSFSISGFVKNTTTTSLSNNLDLGFSSVLSSKAQSVDSEIKLAIIPHVTKVVDGYTLLESDIELNWGSAQFNNLEGKLTINIILKNGGQVNGEPKTNLDLGAKTFIGFKQIVPTTINPNPTVTEAAGLPTDNATEAAIKELIKQNIGEFIKGTLPEGFGVDNITITDIVANNLTGQISTKISLNLYYDDETGVLVESASNPVQVTITGFKTDSTTTSLANNLDLGLVNVLPQLAQQSDADIKAAILPNINGWEGKTPGTVDNIKLDWDSLTYNNLTGQITINVSIIGGKALENGMPVDELNLGAITFIGFKKVKPTEIKTNVDLSAVVQNFYASQSINNVNNLVWDNRELFFTNLPDDFSISNIKVQDAIAENVSKKIEFNLIINKYYNESGILKEDENIRFIIITGFKEPNNNIETSLIKDFRGKDDIFTRTDLINKSNYAYSFPRIDINNWTQVDTFQNQNIKLALENIISTPFSIDLVGGLSKQNDELIYTSEISIWNQWVSNSFWGMSWDELKNRDLTLRNVESVSMKFHFKPLDYKYVNNDSNAIVFRYIFDVSIILKNSNSETTLSRIYSNKNVIFQFCNWLPTPLYTWSGGSLVNVYSTDPSEWSKGGNHSKNWSDLLSGKYSLHHEFTTILIPRRKEEK